MEKLIIASKNSGKINEISKILQDLPVEVISMKDAGFERDIEEKGTTFAENAMLKARCVFIHTKEMVLADDSGLEIDFLNGAPGIYTARFGGPLASQQEKNKKILCLLEDIDDPYRKARFVCSIAFVSKNIEFTVNGSIEGMIAKTPTGEYGFGYDPIFYLPEYKKTFAQLPDHIKNEISHRAIALAKFRKELEMILTEKRDN